MIDPDPTDSTPDSFGDLPMQPTGSGVADLEIAFEQMKLAEDGNGDVLSTAGRKTDQLAIEGEAMTPAEDADVAADSAAHPS